MSKNYKTMRRYTRGEIIRNRAIFAIVVLLLLGLIAFGIYYAVNSLSSPDKPMGDTVSDLPMTDNRSSAQNSSEAPSSEPVVEPETPSSSAQVSSVAPPVSSADTSSSEKKPADDATPILVNPTHKIPEGYSPELVKLPCGYKYEKTAASALADMTAAAKKAGYSLDVLSAYRSNESQIRNFNNSVEKYKKQGKTEDEAYALTAAYIAIPGTSEHSLGLAVDLCSLEESFEDTKTFTWLINNCADYGFILRYPKDKTDITKINYEPWHYRYVGVSHAKEIMSKGLCLEEYLGIMD